MPRAPPGARHVGHVPHHHARRRAPHAHLPGADPRDARVAPASPIRVILPGMCYRNEAISTRSEIQFHQVEGLVVGEGVTMADLKGTITAFARRMFGPERQVRIRCSYFPFTEPSIEVDIDWPKDDPNRDRLTKGTGWLEIMGAGMVHPNVLQGRRLRPGEGDRLRLRHGPAADAHAQARHRRHPPVLAERPAVPAAVSNRKKAHGTDHAVLLAREVFPFVGRGAE